MVAYSIAHINRSNLSLPYVWTAWHPAGRSSGEGGKSKADSRVSYICIASLTGVPPDYSDTLSRRYDFLLQGVS